MNRFNEIFLQAPTANSVAYELAKEYHDRCEAYDVSVCTGYNEQEQCSWPMTSRERFLVNKNAALVYGEVSKKAIALDVDKQELVRAIANYRS